MAKKSLWQRLNEDVRLSDIVTLSRDRTEDRANGVDARVERIWAAATAEAERRGVDVLDVLREQGFDVEANGSATASGGGQKQELLRTLNWSEVAPVAEAAPDASGGFHAVESWPFDDVVASDVTSVLGDLEGFAARLSVFTGYSASLIRELLDTPEARADRWRAAIRAGLPGAAIEAAARCTPYFPPAIDESDGIADRMLLDEVLSYRHYHQAQRRAQHSGTLVFQELVAAHALEPDDWVKALSSASGLPYAAGELEIGPEDAVDTFPMDWARAFRVSPVELETGPAVATPFVPPERAVEGLMAALGGSVQFVLVTPDESDRLVGELAAQRETRPKELPSESHMVGPQRRSLVGDYSILQSAVRAKSAVALVRMLFEGAVQANATDIHLERSGESGRVRYRIDGVLHPVMSVEPTLYDEVVARVKILADMDITERRRPQDGHLHLKLGERTYDLRIASIPTKRGEKVAVRLASSGRIEVALGALGLWDDDLDRLRDVITRPYGIVLAAGPVGSGKTTTLYAALNEFDRDSTNVATIEDPVEIELAGANQVEVNYNLGMDFATGLRALLRQDPDTLLIGEIRDEETAQIAARAGMTGRLVFSTLHANDAVGAITALKNFGVAPHLVSSALQGVVAQRLMRRLCDECKTKVRATPSDRAMFEDHGLELPKPFSPYGPVGCDACFGSGYAGRLGVFEVLRVDREMRRMIIENTPEREIRAYALGHGLRSLQQDAVEKIAQGVTTIQEYRRVLRF